MDTRDDQSFHSVAQLDALSYVGRSALEYLYQYAITNGYGVRDDFGALSDVIFSPQSWEESHVARVEGLINAAQHSLDIAMYSFSADRLYDALDRAAQRGVAIRVVFHTASSDRRKTGDDFANSRSARLEAMGINVRWVNKVMHHKFILVDGPRDNQSRAITGAVATGSANWSTGGATRYDEDTLFLRGIPAITLAFQREFNLMWEHSRDLVFDASLPYILSSLPIDAIPEDPDVDVYFTSSNFSVSGTTFRITGANTVSDALVEAIGRARHSIHIASGHLRSRPVAEALMARAAADPSLDIRVYLDGQEWLSEWAHGEQTDDLEDCLEGAAGSASRTRRCMDSGFRFGLQVGQSGVQVRYKYYAYRWAYAYAAQMHHKFMIIDAEELWSGSYNLSDNAEHNTFENMIVLRGERFASLVATYEARFETMWDTQRGQNTYAELMDRVEERSVFPIVFTPMALNWDEVDALRRNIRANCPNINTDSYRNEPERHLVCFP